MAVSLRGHLLLELPSVSGSEQVGVCMCAGADRSFQHQAIARDFRADWGNNAPLNANDLQLPMETQPCRYTGAVTVKPSATQFEEKTSARGTKERKNHGWHGCDRLNFGSGSEIESENESDHESASARDGVNVGLSVDTPVFFDKFLELLTMCQRPSLPRPVPTLKSVSSMSIQTKDVHQESAGSARNTLGITLVSGKRNDRAVFFKKLPYLYSHPFWRLQKFDVTEKNSAWYLNSFWSTSIWRVTHVHGQALATDLPSGKLLHWDPLDLFRQRWRFSDILDVAITSTSHDQWWTRNKARYQFALDALWRKCSGSTNYKFGAGQQHFAHPGPLLARHWKHNSGLRKKKNASTPLMDGVSTKLPSSPRHSKISSVFFCLDQDHTCEGVFDRRADPFLTAVRH